MSPDALVYGTVCLDRFVRVGHDGEPLPGAEWIELPGGEAFNTATALAGWGVDVVLTGTAQGSDPESDRLRALLDTHPLGLPRARIPDLPGAVTPVCDIRVFPDGERQMRGRGFAQALPPPPLDFAAFERPPLLVIDPNLGRASVETARAAAAAGCPVVSMDFHRSAEVLAVSRIAVTSHEHIETSPGDAARAMVDAGAQVGIVTQGKKGGTAATADGLFPFAAVSIGQALDTTGAGDLFRAGLCYGLLQALSLPETLAFAAAAAGLHCRTLGGGSRPSLTQVWRWQRTLRVRHNAP